MTLCNPMSQVAVVPPRKTVYRVVATHGTLKLLLSSLLPGLSRTRQGKKSTLWSCLQAGPLWELGRQSLPPLPWQLLSTCTPSSRAASNFDNPRQSSIYKVDCLKPGHGLETGHRGYTASTRTTEGRRAGFLAQLTLIQCCTFVPELCRVI